MGVGLSLIREDTRGDTKNWNYLLECGSLVVQASPIR